MIERWKKGKKDKEEVKRKERQRGGEKERKIQRRRKGKKDREEEKKKNIIKYENITNRCEEKKDRYLKINMNVRRSIKNSRKLTRNIFMHKQKLKIKRYVKFIS